MLRATCAEIDLNAIARNLQNIRERVQPSQIMAVVKADAYGHGMTEVAQVALENGASYLGVALLEEGVELRQKGIKAPVLVFGGFFENQIDDYLRFNLQFTLYDMPRARALNYKAQLLGKQATVHVKVDTGMGRVGVAWENGVNFIKNILELKQLNVVGLYTHFATSDEKDKAFAYMQLERFNHLLKQLEENHIRIPLVHAANSGAILDIPEAYFNMVRPGVMMYGYYPSRQTSESIAISPAMTLKSRIIYLKSIKEGETVSYGRTFKATHPTYIATVPVGYADGYNRLLSNRGEVLIAGRRYPVVGRVCMDQILVDVGQDSHIKTGDEVVLMGRQGDEEISIYEICEKLNTIPYEVTCWVSKRVPRVYKKLKE